MPIEVIQLEEMPEPFQFCPDCGAPFESFLRGQVQRLKRPWYWPFGPVRPYCAIICRDCKEIVGYEKP